ncbi:MAG: adenosylcobinamide-phosphate synthase CbiB [Desulfatiglandaceae bacterium]
MIPFELTLILVPAFFLDLILGDPHYKLHPIRLMGGCIAFFTTGLKRLGLYTKAGGILLVGMVAGTFLIPYWTLAAVFHHIHGLLGLGFDVFMVYSCLALKDLFSHTDRVIQALERNHLSRARKGIALVVGRDVRTLDETGVSRAAIETLAENFVDGFLSPIFWYVSGGLLGYVLGVSPVATAVSLMLVFKVISTLDSMVGYKNVEYVRFGWAGARGDDVMNFLPARVSLVILFIGAWICRCHAPAGLRTALRDRLKHESPNAGHPESFMAGALNVRLGGPTLYPEGLKPKPWLGKAYPDPLPRHIRKAGALLKSSAWAAMGISTLILLILWYKDQF